MREVCVPMNPAHDAWGRRALKHKEENIGATLRKKGMKF